MSSCPSGPGAPLPWEHVAQLALDVGLTPGDAVTAVAVAQGESGRRPQACGDVDRAGEATRDGRTWGPSIGLWQIRSILELAGTGATRDPEALDDPEHNALAMADLSGGGRSWGDWSVYTEGTYRRYVDRAGRAVGDAAGADIDTGSDGGDQGASLDSGVGESVDTLTSPSTWGRVLQAVGGIAAVVAGLALILWDVLPGRQIASTAIDAATGGD